MAKKPKCEAEVQSTLALHLFKPLSGDASTTVDEKVYQRSKVPKQCLHCKEPVNAGDTSFGKLMNKDFSINIADPLNNLFRFWEKLGGKRHKISATWTV